MNQNIWGMGVQGNFNFLVKWYYLENYFCFFHFTTLVPLPDAVERLEIVRALFPKAWFGI